MIWARTKMVLIFQGDGKSQADGMTAVCKVGLFDEGRIS